MLHKNMMTLQNNDKINQHGSSFYSYILMFSMAEFMKWKLTESGLTKFNH